MKKFPLILIVVALVAALVSCESLARGALEGAIGATGNAAASGVPAVGTVGAAVDFQSGDILAGRGAGSMLDADWGVARVLTAASTATKNQAEILWASNGQKEWVNYAVQSRKAVKADFAVGAAVFANTYIGVHEKTDQDTYRKGNWFLGRVTSTENLFKGLIEINGDDYYADFCRIPLDPVK